MSAPLHAMFSLGRLEASNPRDAGRNAYIIGLPEHANPYMRCGTATLFAARQWHMGWLLEQADDVGRRT